MLYRLRFFLYVLPSAQPPIPLMIPLSRLLGPAMRRVFVHVAPEPPIADDHAFAAGLRRTCDPPRVLPFRPKLAAVDEHDLVPFVGKYLFAADVNEALAWASSASLRNL
ncbi:hypothetical protein HWV62_4675 [Athelia sp. TMB]|nr:hypothetical protein HWV62_4675 [Athelia sp. TMB]